MIQKNQPYIVAITGASGTIYGLRLVQTLAELKLPVALIVSDAARLVMREELGLEIQDLADESFLSQLFAPETLKQVTYFHYKNLAAPIASGSFPVRGMMIVPASTTCFSRIANGISETLVERAAECVIKEGRMLTIVPRETPLSVLHLEHLLKLARAGVRVVPASPAFYAGAKSVGELVDFVVGKTLDQFGITHGLFRRWTGIETPEAKEAKWTESWQSIK